MPNDKTIKSVMSGKQDNNIKFDDLCKLAKLLGFRERIKGSHFIYKHPNYPERINIQPNGSMAKSYQVRQVRAIIIKYNMHKGGQQDDQSPQI